MNYFYCTTATERVDVEQQKQVCMLAIRLVIQRQAGMHTTAYETREKACVA